MISMLWLVLCLHAGPWKRTAAEILVEAKLSAKAIPQLTPGRSSSRRSWEGKSALPRVVCHFVAAGNRTRLLREGAGGEGATLRPATKRGEKPRQDKEGPLLIGGLPT